MRIFEKFRKFLEQFRFFGIFEKLFFSILSCYSAYYRYRSMIGKFLSNFFQFHLTRWPKMTFKWPFKDPKVWNLTLKPINYPILLIQLICQLQNTHFSDILTTSLKKVKVPRILDIAQIYRMSHFTPSIDDQPKADRSRSILMSRWSADYTEYE